MEDARIPVTILTGFLGSGKTTLLNALIQQYPEKKFAIIENEFGEINIDSDLVVGVEDGIFELSNGCVCCSLNTELVATINKITEQHPNLNHLIIETTGIADPGPVANSFIADVSIQARFRLDAIIALSDAQFIEQQMVLHEEARKQIAMADLVLLNKIDKVEKYLLETAQNVIRRINPEVTIAHAEFGKTDGLDLLHLNAFSATAVMKLNFTPSRPNAGKGNLMSPKGRMPNVHEASNITSHSIIIKAPLDILKFDTWMNLMLNFNSQNFYRIKGILNMEEFDQKVVFQAVNNQYVSESGGLWGDEERLTKMVFIGKNLDKELLENGLSQCCYSALFVSPETFYKSILELQEKIYLKNKEQLLTQSQIE